MTYTQSGNYTALAGLIVLALSKFLNIETTPDIIIAIIAGVVSLVGIIKQAVDHKNLAVAAGAIPPR